jgi:hypothetical protein
MIDGARLDGRLTAGGELHALEIHHPVVVVEDERFA